MRICVLGGDGYLGWPTAMRFAVNGADVLVVDNFAKRSWERACGVAPLVTVPALDERIAVWNRTTAARSLRPIDMAVCDLSSDHDALCAIFARFRPDTIIHYAEQPSAPYSMANAARAVETQCNNVAGTLNLIFAMRDTCPDAHLIKLGTLGEYGTPNIDIEEGWLDVEHNGRRDRVLFPKRPGSFYHLSKVHDSANLEFACRAFDLRVTDLNQGIVYGIETPEMSHAPGLHTSFHYDSVFGTVINRFVVEAVIGERLTVYGGGQQQRGIIDIRDTLRCVELSARNPAARGEFRVFNQLTEQFRLEDIAARVVHAAATLGIRAEVTHLANPRTEAEDHHYVVRHERLLGLGLEPHLLSEQTLIGMLRYVARHSDHLIRDSLLPGIDWRTGEHTIEPVAPAQGATG